MFNLRGDQSRGAQRKRVPATRLERSTAHAALFYFVFRLEERTVQREAEHGQWGGCW